jgi:hypothetical protein
MSGTDQFAQRPIDRRKIATYRSNVPNFTFPSGFRNTYVDGILVHIQPDKQDARLFHGLPPSLE